MSLEKDLYAILGASPSDSVQQLRHKYQKLALQYHPDRLGDVCDFEAETSIKMFLDIDAAWKILCEVESRKKYDQQRRDREFKQDWPVDSVVSLKDMTWDQDDHVYKYCCRCGGQFSFLEEEVQRRIDEENSDKCQDVVVCCDTCSLSVYVK
ncbi:dnaJ homolog subfamily C member 24 isoform X1 [Stigmatopora argus]